MATLLLKFHADTRRQGGMKFEISWEPDFPVNNFARNNGNNRVIINTIINIKVVTKNKTGQKYTVKGSMY